MIIKKNTGMTIVEIVVAIAVFGLLSTVFATSFVEVFKAQKSVENKDRSNDLATSVGRFIYKDATCNQGLQNIEIPSAVDTKTEISINNFPSIGTVTGSSTPDGSPTISLAQGVTFDGNMRIKSLTIERTAFPPVNVRSGGQNLTKITAKIQLSLEILNRQTSDSAGSWTELAPRFFEIPIVTNATNQVVECNVDVGMEDVCRSLGRQFNESTGQCQKTTTCEVTGSFVEKSCSPNPSSRACPAGENNEMTGAQNCPRESVKKQSGKYSWSFTENCGKKCTRTINVMETYFVCMECPPNVE